MESTLVNWLIIALVMAGLSTLFLCGLSSIKSKSMKEKGKND